MGGERLCGKTFYHLMDGYPKMCSSDLRRFKHRPTNGIGDPLAPAFRDTENWQRVHQSRRRVQEKQRQQVIESPTLRYVNKVILRRPWLTAALLTPIGF